MADLTNYTPVKVKDLTELTQINETSYIVITDGTSTKKIKAILLKGQDGVTPVFQIGSVSTLVEGSNATVNMTNVGGVYTINFGIPRGQSGSGGTSSGMTETQLNQLSIAYGTVKPHMCKQLTFLQKLVNFKMIPLLQLKLK